MTPTTTRSPRGRGEERTSFPSLTRRGSAPLARSMPRTSPSSDPSQSRPWARAGDDSQAVVMRIVSKRRPLARSRATRRPSAVGTRTSRAVRIGEATTLPTSTLHRGDKLEASEGFATAPIRSAVPRKKAQVGASSPFGPSSASRASAAAAADAKRALGSAAVREDSVARRVREERGAGGGPSRRHDTCGIAAVMSCCRRTPNSKRASRGGRAGGPGSRRGRPSAMGMRAGSMAGNRGGDSPCARSSSRARSRPRAKAASSVIRAVKLRVARRRWSSSVPSGMGDYRWRNPGVRSGIVNHQLGGFTIPDLTPIRPRLTSWSLALYYPYLVPVSHSMA